MPLNISEAFMPRWHSVLHNPFYIIRKRLFTSLRNNAHHISGTVLDFGCGTKPYEEMFTCDKYIGLDYETEVSSKGRVLKADFFYDGKTIPFPDNHFDSVFSSEVLEHVFNPDQILTELHRVMKPGAKMLLSCPFFWPEHEQPYDYARYSSFGLKSLMQDHGFEVVNYEKTGNYFECVVQSIVLYIFYFIPHKPKVLETLFFLIFISPFLVFNLAVSKILPMKIKRSDFYLNNVIVVRKV